MKTPQLSDKKNKKTKESIKTPAPSLHLDSEPIQTSHMQHVESLDRPTANKELPPVLPVTFFSAFQKKTRSIDFLSLLQYKEYIAGFAVSEDSLAYTLYRSGPNGVLPGAYSEVSLPSGVIVDGMLKDKEQWGALVKELFNKISGTHTSSVILSVLPHHIWMATLEFPHTLDKKSLIDAIGLYFEFTLPFPREKSYIDWEILDDKNTSGIQRVEVGAVYKEHIDPYLDVLKKEGITAIAVESHLMSVARCLSNGCTLFVIIYPSGAHMGAYTDHVFRFQRFIPWEHMQRGKDNKKSPAIALCDEITSMIHFLRTETHLSFETEHITLVASQDFRDSFVQAITNDSLLAFFKNENDIVSDPAHAVVCGAALRGLLSRKDDTIMSFTAVGTEKIYEWKRAISFSAFFEKLAIGLSIFFILLYIGSFLFVTTLARRAENRQSAQGVILQDLVKIQEEARQFNQTIGSISDLTKRAPHWKKLFDHISRLTNPGITIHSLSIDNPSDVILTGVATNRDALLQFKASVNSSGIFHEVEFPFSLLVTKENLPFRFSLSFRDHTFLLTP